MIGTEDQFIIWGDGTFNCPVCQLVHWPKDYDYAVKEQGKEFDLRCVNRTCRQRLVLIVEGLIIKVTTKAWHESHTKGRKVRKNAQLEKKSKPNVKN